MTTSSSPELDAATLIARISSGELARDFILLVARGFLPLPQEELIAVLVFLTRSEDQEIQEQARISMREIPPRIVVGFARNPDLDPALLQTLAESTNDPAVLEAVLRNRTTSDETIVALASRVPGSLQDVIVVNQERILRTPAILEALLANTSLSGDVRRRALELREEFFEKRRPAKEEPLPELPPLDEEPLTPEQQAELDALLLEAQAFDQQQPEPPPEEPPEIAQDESADSAWRRIAKMTVAQKVQCAFRGGQTERSILIRERNKLVATSVIRSPRITDNEVEGYAGMRNIEEDILRIIGMNRTWMSKYSIMTALVRNPKAPIGVVLPLINRLTLRDLKSLTGDKGVSETVRQSAKRLYVQRQNR